MKNSTYMNTYLQEKSERISRLCDKESHHVTMPSMLIARERLLNISRILDAKAGQGQTLQNSKDQ